MNGPTQTSGVDAIYREVFEGGVRYSLPRVELTRTGFVEPAVASLTIAVTDASGADATWLGGAYRLSVSGRPLTGNELRLVDSISRVLAARYRSLSESASAAAVDLFRGLPEDRFVSAFLDPTPYVAGQPSLDRIADAIEVLRICSSSTYENRRINTGVLLFGDGGDPCHDPPPRPRGALPYAKPLTTTRTFYRLSDGMRTVALVDRGGCMVELVDIAEWAAPFAGMPLPAPSAARFVAHSRATLCGDHVCLVLTPNGEIKIFAAGMQMFSFLDGRWRLSDVVEKYRAWEHAVGSPALADRLFTTAINLAERRRGGLFIVLNDASAAEHLVAMADRLDASARVHDRREGVASKDQFQYLLRGRSVLDLTATVLESIARIDGAIVLDRDANLLAFGAIVRLHFDPALDREVSEGGRTTAAMVASRYGEVLKVSEDGVVVCYSSGRAVWEL